MLPPEKPARASKSLAVASASARVAPGTTTARAASYAALSAAWRMLLKRVNSIIPIRKVNRIGRISESSTVVAPMRREARELPDRGEEAGMRAIL